MDTIEFFLELFGGSALLFGSGCLIGHLLNLNKFSDDLKKSQQLHLRKAGLSMNEPDDLIKDNDF